MVLIMKIFLDGRFLDTRNLYKKCVKICKQDSFTNSLSYNEVKVDFSRDFCLITSIAKVCYLEISEFL